MSLGSFVIFQGSGPVAKETIFCDILEGVLWTPPPPRIWIRAWREYRVRPDIIMSGLIWVQTVCIKNHFGKILPGTSSMDQHQT